MKDQLSYTYQSRQSNGGRQGSEKTFIDFVVSNQPLSEVLDIASKDLVGMLGWGFNIEAEVRVVQEFLKTIEPELESGRTILYGCPECGDIGCGAITVKIEKQYDSVVWSEIGYENGYEEIRFAEFEHLGPFEFELKPYEDKFKEIEGVVRV